MSYTDLGAPQSRNEAILMNMLGATYDLSDPQSRIEYLLIEILNNGGGGGGGTTNYNALSNKPQINSVELSGNKSLADLGITVDSALSTSSENAVQNKVVTLALNEKLSIAFSMPAAAIGFLGKQVLYVGSNTQDYTKGYMYECQEVPDTSPTEYAWVQIGAYQIVIDSSLSTTSEHPVQNKVITQELGKRLVIASVMPEASEDLEGEQRLYVGATNLNYSLGNIYECQEIAPATDPKTYHWVVINVADPPVDSALSTVSENPVQNKIITAALNDKLGKASTMPTPSAALLNMLIVYSGETTATYTKGVIYECLLVPESDPAEYVWQALNTFEINADDALSLTSENPVQNKVITAALNGKVGKASTMPAASESLLNMLVVYSGETTQDYTKGVIYQCLLVPESDPAEYVWQALNTFEINADTTLSLTSENAVQNKVITAALNTKLEKITTMPAASADLEGKQYIYLGQTDVNYTQGLIYECQEITPVTEPKTYHWVAINALNITIDGALSTTSQNPVENRVVTAAINEKVSSNVDLDNTDDLDDVVVSGFYNAESTDNSPYADAFVMVMANDSGDCCYQMAVDQATGNKSQRMMINGTWGSWEAMNYVSFGD